MRGNQRVPGIVWRRRFGAPRVCTTWRECYWSFLFANLAEIARCSSEEAAWQVAGRDSGFCITITHRATHRLLCSNSCHHTTTVLSGSHSEWLLAVPYSENGPQGDTFATMVDIKSNATAELRKIPKEAFRQCFQQWHPRWSNVNVRKGLTLKVIG
jgi:hypothetical protein